MTTTPEPRASVFDLALGRIGLPEFVCTTGIDPEQEDLVAHALRDALASQQADEVERALLLTAYSGFDDDPPPKAVRDCVPTLCELLLAHWHQSHEDIARALQRLRDPRSIEALAHTALAAHDEVDDGHALARKCIGGARRLLLASRARLSNRA